MRLFRLTFATIFQRKAWAICVFAVIALPFALPLISSATEKPLLVQPARIQAAWNTLWICASSGASSPPPAKAKTTPNPASASISSPPASPPPASSLKSGWRCSASSPRSRCSPRLICQFAAAPADPVERSMWWVLNAQYAALFLLVIAPLLALATALASRFGGITGFTVTLLITLYGLYGVGYLDNMLKLEENPILQGFLAFSPHYRFADLTQRLYFKTGALPPGLLDDDPLLRRHPRRLRRNLAPLLPHQTLRLIFLNFSISAFQNLSFFNLQMSRIIHRHQPGLIGSGVLAWAFAGRPLLANPDLRAPLNPLGINGSPYGEVFAMAMQGPIDTHFHRHGLRRRPPNTRNRSPACDPPQAAERRRKKLPPISPSRQISARCSPEWKRLR
jgi:hypothetical protein